MSTPPSGEILFLCHRVPFPPDRGDKIRSHAILRHLSGMAPVHVGCFADDERDMGFANDLATIAASQCIVPHGSRALGAARGLVLGQPMLVALFESTDLHRWVRHMLATRPIAAIVAYSAQMAHFVPALPANIRFLMDFVDFDSAKYAEYGAAQRGPMGWVNRREGRKLFAFERGVAARADMSIFVSEAEAVLFRSATGFGPDRVKPLDNGVALAKFSPDADFTPLSPQERGEGPLVVFTGQMDYRPNVEAVESFARASLPAIRAAHPTARFAIVGRNPAPSVRALAPLPGVIVTGAVDDVRGWLAAADVVVAPLRIARGIQNKVLEAMAMARPVVASPQAAEGIDAISGTHFLVVGAQDEGTAVASLISDRVLADALGAAARARMVERYDWAATLAPLGDMLFAKDAA